MEYRSSSVHVAFLFSGLSIALAIVSINLGQRVNYLDYLAYFNAMAAGMLLLSAAGAVAGLVGLWRAKGRGVGPWLATLSALLLIVLYLSDP